MVTNYTCTVVKTEGSVRGQDGSVDTAMLWAACCLCYFGFLWIGEITVMSDSSSHPKAHLCITDLAVDNRKSLMLLWVTIKHSHFVKVFHYFSIKPLLLFLCPVLAIIASKTSKLVCYSGSRTAAS